MGVEYRLKFWRALETPSRTSDVKRIEEVVADLMRSIDREMSTYRADSEISRFNRGKAELWHPVSARLAHVVHRAMEFSAATGGAQDCTVGPLVRLWKFGPYLNSLTTTSETVAGAPTNEQIHSALRTVGSEFVEVREQSPALLKHQAAVELDLSSIAPGYAVDLIGELLDSYGYKNYLVDLSGEIRGCGTRPDMTEWHVAIERPSLEKVGLSRVIPVRDICLATSGDYRRVRYVSGEALAHVIDPRTGRPLPVRGFAVTVLASNCLEADALATALLVMGPTAGYDWCIERDAAALFQSKDSRGDELIEHETPRFRRLTEANQ
jgi:thiamine biosynthesis lipoprotein